VVILDAVWGSMMVETGETKTDKRGRKRRVKRGKKIPLLVALGVDPVTGETTLLAWRQGTAEGEDDWTALLTILYRRGIHADNGLRLFIHDGVRGWRVHSRWWTSVQSLVSGAFFTSCGMWRVILWGKRG
jgi:hypothetical protein